MQRLTNNDFLLTKFEFRTFSGRYFLGSHALTDGFRNEFS